MLDIKRILEDRNNVEKGLLKRLSKDEFDLEEIIEIYERKKELQQEFDAKRSEQNQYNDKMASLEKGSEEFKTLIVQLKQKAQEAKEIENKLKEAEKDLNLKLEILPNIPDEDVPSGGKENNEIVKEFEKCPVFDFEIKDHVEISENLGILDFETGAKVSGNNFFLYKGLGAQLEWALLNYFIQTHLDDGYKMILPPHIVNKESAYSTGQLPKFKEDLYWVNENQCLIPTSETVLTSMHRDDVLEEKDLPEKLFAYTPCYRREAGSYRANERGLVRVHQFNKVEMYQFTTPEKSQDALEELTLKAEELVEGLGLHYHRVKLAAGDCSDQAAKTYDIEVWLPSMQKYYEVSSVSNVKDYQARRGNMRYRGSDGKLSYLHTLNASGLATTRLMVAILETYQQEDGIVVVPEVLRPYMGGIERIEK
jgi:seryl-tRNA synthetase